MKKITIKLDDDLAHWCKVWAARNGTSVSRFLAALLRRARREQEGYAQAMKIICPFLRDKLKDHGGYPSREDMHAR